MIAPLTPDEAVFACQACGQVVAVGPCHEHLDPAVFRCSTCLPWKPANDGHADELAATIARARGAQNEAVR